MQNQTNQPPRKCRAAAGEVPLTFHVFKHFPSPVSPDLLNYHLQLKGLVWERCASSAEYGICG